MMVIGKRLTGILLGVLHVLQLILVVAAWYLDGLTSERMMVMRYFVAKNTLWQESYFSAVGTTVQMGVLALVVIALIALAFKYVRANHRFDAIEVALGADISLAILVCLAFLTTEDILALYALVMVGWVALILQFGVIVIARIRRKSDNV